MLTLTDSLLAQLPYPIFCLDKAGFYQFCNNRYEKLTGLSWSNIKHKSISEIYSDEITKKLLSSIQKSLQLNKKISYLKKTKFKSKIKFFQVKISPLSITDHKIKELVLIIEEDVTKIKQAELNRKKREKKLENSIYYLENIISNFPASVYWKDKEGHILGDNLTHAKMAGFDSQDKVIGKTDHDFPWKNQAKQIRKNDIQVMKTETTQTFEELGSLTNGVPNVFLTIKTPLYDRSKKLAGIIGISMDITERKEMEEELTKAKEEAEAYNYIMIEFISNMGHILVTPLSKITGVATVLLYGYADKYLELKPQFEELMEGCTDWDKAYSQVVKGTSLTELEINIESFSINEELQNIVSIMKHSIGSKNIKLILNSFVPKKGDNDLIETDKLKFHLILTELIFNAIKFTEQGNITINVYKQDGWFNIEVSDTGIGIPPDKLGFIFKQFTMLSRAQTHGANFNGVGAGLFLTEQRAKLLQAKISVTSEVGKGSTFTLSIPAKFKKI